jgi:hypothetical protein
VHSKQKKVYGKEQWKCVIRSEVAFGQTFGLGQLGSLVQEAG